jgi:hypothetical protein
VPTEDVASVLSSVGGIGHGVFSQTRHQSFGSKGDYSPPFWIPCPNGKRFETLVHTWDNHNKTVLLPDSSFLERFRLIPRITKDGNILWDDPDGPVYDVVRVIPLSHYSTDSGFTVSRISIRKDYLEEFLSQKKCSAVATYFDERFSFDDPEVAALIGTEGNKFEQPGRKLWFMKMNLDFANQVSQVWACALLLSPAGSPISKPAEVDLMWPDRSSPITGEGIDASFGVMERAYVRDEVLTEYEQRSEFEISPEQGFVSYDGRWSVSYCDRFGRNHIEIELRKLYEGAPLHVIKHYNTFAVKSSVAEKDRQTNGNRHVGIRAHELVYSFLQLTSTLSDLCDATGLSCSQAEVGQLTTAEIKYRGWWTFSSLKLLGNVIPLNLSFAAFLNRSKEIAKLLEHLRPGPLLNVLIKLGLNKADIKEFKALKLLATLAQLATISKDSGLDLVSDSAQIAPNWQADTKIDALKPLFALLTLRTADAHKTSSSTPIEISKALEVFGIDEAKCQGGWGEALDCIYDAIVSSLTTIASQISSCVARAHRSPHL